MIRFLALACSIRTTVGIIIMLTLLLLLNVLVPQQNVVGREEIDRMASASPLARITLVTLGLSRISTSPLFVAVLGLFFVNLVAVLIDRTRPMLGRLRERPPDAEGLRRWAAGPQSIGAPLVETVSMPFVSTVLRGFGYRARRVGDGEVWAVRHSMAPLGFFVFHLSFFFICAGGAMIYYTRSVGSVRLVEGQQFDGTPSRVIREAPLGPGGTVPFTLVSMDPKLVGGEPVELKAVVRASGLQGGDAAIQVNHPAKWGTRSVLVNEAGIAPTLWIQDEQGYTLARTAIVTATLSGTPAEMLVPRTSSVVSVTTKIDRSHFPSREELVATSFEIVVRDGAKETARGTLRRGEALQAGPLRIVVENVSFWGGFLIVDERGGVLLITGFVLGVVGAIWRLLLHRREIVVAWSGSELRLAGRGEFFARGFQAELEDVRDALLSPVSKVENQRESVEVK